MASTSPEQSEGPAPAPTRRRLLSGWGRTAPSAADVARPATRTELAHSLDDLDERGALARGLGRSYGDAAQNAGGRVIDTTGVTALELDPTSGAVTASAGMDLDHLLKVLVPRGFFVPVTPGTRQVTVGGAFAADIHGKNHHRAGSWSDHVASFRLLTPDGTVHDVSRELDAELFRATAGGMGLTGVLLDATFHCPRIETSRLVVDTDRAPDLDTAMALMEEGDERYPYSVAWIDLVATGRHLGRSVLTSGRFARLDELPATDRSDALAFEPLELLGAPPGIPSGLLNPLTIRAFNELWYRKAPVRRRDELQTIGQFFHPLDGVRNWNRLYGPQGFLQWQCVVPFGAEDTLRAMIERLARSGCPSFLAVLKRFGPGNDAHLSFPAPGWTLALDIPTASSDLGRLLDELDAQVAQVGGRIYLAKDARLRPELLGIMYPRLEQWRQVKARIDPDNRMRSDLGRRLGLC